MEIEKLEWKDTIAIRHQVLWPNEDPMICRVEGDDDALHFGISIETALVCVASLYVENNRARLRKFATLIDFQGKGVGTCMLNYLIDELKRVGVDYLWLDARESAIDFYARFGLNTFGESFYKKDVLYRKMEVNL